MSPRLLIDTSHLVVRSLVPLTDTGASEAYKVERAESSKQQSERRTQIRALVTGTLLFLPFLAVYAVACAGR
jgi:hypothetical protein